MKTKRRTADCFEDGWLKKEYLWPLRQEIVLGSVFVADYRNSFGIDEHKVCDFFTSFWEGFCEELAKEDGLMAEAQKRYDASDCTVSVDSIYLDLNRERYDNEDTIISWYNCFDGGPEDCPLPPKMVNVDIHWDFARSIQVIAADEYEAEDIVDEMMNNGEIPQSTFEGCGWELDTSYQPK